MDELLQCDSLSLVLKRMPGPGFVPSKVAGCGSNRVGVLHPKKILRDLG